MPSGLKMLNLPDIPLRSPEYLKTWGSTMIIAPHQDDETLGCGGAITLLCRQQQPVSVLFVSDGTMSHPRSRKYPAEARRSLREEEARAALQTLGVRQDATFLRWPDTRVPMPDSEDFAAAVSGMRMHIQSQQPDTVLVPWRRDPHCDHRAAWQIVQAALQEVPGKVRVVEYPVWVWELAQPGDLPQPGEMQAWRLDIGKVLDVKRQAIAAYPSQTTRLIADDPEGFMLTPEVLAHFTQPYEVYLEPNDDVIP